MENQATKPPMILVMESDPLYLTGIAAILDMQGYRCFLAKQVEIARQATESIAFDLLILSIDDDLDEAVALTMVVKSSPISMETPVIFLAPFLDAKWIGPLNSVGGVFCLPKPVEPDLLLDAVDKTLWMPHLANAKIAPPSAHFSNQWVRLS